MGCGNFCRFFKMLRTPGRERQASRSARDGDRAAVDTHWRAHLRRHGGLRKHRGAVAAVVTLDNGIPSHDMFSRLFAKLDPAGPQQALLCLTRTGRTSSATWWR